MEEPKNGKSEIHPIVLGLRKALGEMAAKLTPDVAPADVYSPGERKSESVRDVETE